MKNINLDNCKGYRTLVIHNDVVDYIGLDLASLQEKGYAIVDDNAVCNYFMNLEWFDCGDDDYEEMCYSDVEFDSAYEMLERIISMLVGFEVKVESMRDGLYIWDWHQHDFDEVMLKAA